MSGIKIDVDRQKMRYLLRQLSLERLDRDGAEQLRPMLQMELDSVSDPRYRDTLSRLIKLLSRYIAGEINLMKGINVRVAGVQ
jgi:hypothetical protein